MKNIFSLIGAFTIVGCSEETTIEPMLTEPSVVNPVADVIQPEPPVPPAISIWDAARAGDIEVVREHVASGTELNGRDGSNSLKQTPLHCAVESTQMAVVELLLAKGADINAEREDGLTALDIVLKADPNASDEDRALRKTIASILVRNGATATKHK